MNSRDCKAAGGEGREAGRCLGIMYQAAGQYEDAVLDLKYFISLNKDDSTNKKEIADARARLAELTP